LAEPSLAVSKFFAVLINGPANPAKGFFATLVRSFMEKRQDSIERFLTSLNAPIASGTN
jgi:hypothetical protein